VVDVFTNLVICVNINQTLHGRHHRVLGLWLNDRTIALDQKQLGNLSSCVAARVGEHIVKKPGVLTQAKQIKCQLCKHTRDDRCSLEAWEQAKCSGQGPRSVELITRDDPVSCLLERLLS
jgi:hypothetical protein